MDQRSFEIRDDDRYSRLQLIAWWDQEKLRQCRVLVVGAGALGNEVLKNLALVGVGRIEIVDFDRIECSNVSRSVLFRPADEGRPKAEVAADAVRELNPEVHVNAIVGDVTADIGLGRVRAADVVIGCLDNREARLWVNRMCWKVNRPWIDGGIQEINGVCKVFRPSEGPCYECGMTEADYRLMQLRYSCPLLRQSDLQQGRVPTAPTIASIIGGLQVQEALKLLHGFPAGDATALVFNGVTNQFYQTRYPFRPDCLSHETYGEIRTVPLTCSATAAELLDFAADFARVRNGELVLDRDWVRELTCEPCGLTAPVERPLGTVRERDAACPNCGQTMLPRMIHRISRSSPWATRLLHDLGVPDFDIVKVESDGGTCTLELRPLAPEVIEPKGGPS
jgi:adenylyltransferase/sulfurtransferase